MDHSKVLEVASKVSNQSEKEGSLVSDAESQIFKIETVGGFGLARRDSLRQEQEQRIFYDYVSIGRTSFSRQRQSYGNVGNSVPCSSHQSLRYYVHGVNNNVGYDWNGNDYPGYVYYDEVQGRLDEGQGYANQFRYGIVGWNRRHFMIQA